jgi:hypothetical protein
VVERAFASRKKFAPHQFGWMTYGRSIEAGTMPWFDKLTTSVLPSLVESLSRRLNQS